jgi:hypothetical protein
MQHGPRPPRKDDALLHNHFATSINKVFFRS